MGEKNLKKRLETLEALEEIRDAISTYVHTHDSKNIEGLMAIFDENATCSYPHISVKGSKNIKVMYLGTFNDWNNMRHTITSPIVKVTDNEAESKCYWHFYGTFREQYPLEGEGLYHHKFRKMAGSWKIVEQTVEVHWQDYCEENELKKRTRVWRPPS